MSESRSGGGQSKKVGIDELSEMLATGTLELELRVIRASFSDGQPPATILEAHQPSGEVVAPPRVTALLLDVLTLQIFSMLPRDALEKFSEAELREGFQGYAKLLMDQGDTVIQEMKKNRVNWVESGEVPESGMGALLQGGKPAGKIVH